MQNIILRNTSSLFTSSSLVKPKVVNSQSRSYGTLPKVNGSYSNTCGIKRQRNLTPVFSQMSLNETQQEDLSRSAQFSFSVNKAVQLSRSIQDKVQPKTEPQYVEIFDPLGLFKKEDLKAPQMNKPQPQPQPKQENRDNKEIKVAGLFGAQLAMNLIKSSSTVTQFNSKMQKQQVGVLENIRYNLEQKIKRQTKNQLQNLTQNFSIQKLDESKTIDNFQDKSINMTPEYIRAQLLTIYDDFMKSDQGKNLRNAMIALIMATQAFSPQQAFADVPDLQSAGEAGKQVYAEYASKLQGNITYSRFMEAVEAHRIVAVKIFEGTNTAKYFSAGGGQGMVQLLNDPELFKKLDAAGVDLSAELINKDYNFLFSLAPSFFGALLILGLITLFQRNSSVGFGGGMNPMNVGKSKARLQMEPNTGVTFGDVAGVNEAKQELAEVVDFLKQPEQYTKLGAKIPRGALLIGPPGTGKTLLAKAVAGEAGVPFFSISAAEFIEMFVGVGASRVRDLFEQAKKNAPCIIFIDELDAVGRQRAQGLGQGNDEREQTINQLLTEMDGFEGNKGIIVLAATNIPEVLDKALLRPGRFDRQIAVALPDYKGRCDIIKVHAKGKKLAAEVDLNEIAKRCLGFSGADLANLMNESAIFSARKGKTEIGYDDIIEALDRIQIGLEKKGGKFSDKRQNLVAYHEAGHALLGAVMKEYDLVNKISIIPRGASGGVTIFTPNEEVMESGMYSKDYLLNRICVGMGGRIAEEIINGKEKITTGAQNDFQQVTNTAKMMVEAMGMSDVVGPRNIGGAGGQGGMGPYNRNMAGMGGEGTELKAKVDGEIDRILREQYQRGMNILTENKYILDAIAKKLIEKEKMAGTELLELIKSFNPELVDMEAMRKVEQLERIGAK